LKADSINRSHTLTKKSPATWIEFAEQWAKTSKMGWGERNVDRHQESVCGLKEGQLSSPSRQVQETNKERFRIP